MCTTFVCICMCTMCVHLHVHDVFLHLYVHDECASCVHADFALSSAVGMAAVQRNTSYMYTCARTHTRTHTNIYMYTHTHTHTQTGGGNGGDGGAVEHADKICFRAYQARYVCSVVPACPMRCCARLWCVLDRNRKTVALPALCLSELSFLRFS